MIPKEKVQEIIAKYNSIEKELSSGNIEAKLYAKKSKEYSNLKSIITAAKEYFNFEIKEKDLDQIIEDKDNDPEIIEMAEKDLIDLKKKNKEYENELKIFLLPKDSDDEKKRHS